MLNYFLQILITVSIPRRKIKSIKLGVDNCNFGGISAESQMMYKICVVNKQRRKGRKEWLNLLRLGGG